MAEVAQGEANFLVRKVGPAPIWVWALLGLVLAWAFAKYRDLKNSAAAATAAAPPGAVASSESQDVAPQFIIEENLPTVPVSITGAPSAPVTMPPVPAAPVTTPPSTSPQPPIASRPTAPPPRKTSAAPLHYIVQHGDNLSSIAARYHTTAARLFEYNTTPGVRPASTIATLRKRGPNLLYSGETILIPRS
jgi:LysM repeat protein